MGHRLDNVVIEGNGTMNRKMVALVAGMVMMASAAWAGDAMNTSALHPPAGKQMALVRHDFVIPNHPWSKDAHIMARYFDSLSLQVGEEFRQYIFANQNAIYKTNLREWADRFAKAHHTALPAFYDPTGAFRAKVEADTELGKATGVHQTPTIYVVTNSPKVPYEQVLEQAKLFETIEKVKNQLPPEKAKKK